ncbi:hypothetical protein JW766_06645 [Candidatus Dojkabacteria bacterium]|nr:hypothetical protein [Candidatus Dojkabacteria bacterium]
MNSENKICNQEAADKSNQGGDSDSFFCLVKQSGKRQVAFLVAFLIISVVLGGAVFAYGYINTSNSKEKDSVGKNNITEDKKNSERNGDHKEEVNEDTIVGQGDVQKSKTFSITKEEATFEFEYFDYYYASEFPFEGSEYFPVEINVRTTEETPSYESSDTETVANVLIVKKSEARENVSGFPGELTEEEGFLMTYTANQCFIANGPYEHIILDGNEVVRIEETEECFLPSEGDDPISPLKTNVIAYGVSLDDEYFGIVYNISYGNDILRDDILRQIAGSIRVV